MDDNKEIIKANQEMEPSEEHFTENTNSVIGEVLYGEVLDAQHKHYQINVKNVASKLLQLFNFEDIISNIEADKEYVVVIPREFREALEKGEAWLMKNKDNPELMRPQIMEKAKSGKNQVVKQLGIKEKDLLKGNPVQELSQQCQMMCLQGQVQDVAMLLEEAIEEIKLIEDTQDAERIGLLTAGREQLLLAFNQQDEEMKKIAIQNAIATLSEAKGQTIEVLKDRCEKFEAIPENKLLQLAKVMLAPRTDFLSRNGARMQKMQKYFECVSDATRIMATAYLMIGEKRNAKLVYESTISQIKALDAEKLKTARFIPDKYLPKDNLELPYDFIVIFEEKKDECINQLNNSDKLQIAISGEILLEEYNKEEI